MNRDEDWPELEFGAWRETALTLQLWSQMAGKVRLAHEPWLNHGWQVPLYVTSTGVGTSLIHAADRGFEIRFDFIRHRLLVRCSNGAEVGFPLEQMKVADFHQRLRSALDEIGVDNRFSGVPNEVPDPIPFAADQRQLAYDADAVHRWWRALLSVDRVFKLFRTGFVGKASPVHLFWGSFDLAVTRFSGRPAPPHPGGIPGLPDDVAREAYDQEVSSAGFWPGDARFPQAAFYSYAYPQPGGFGAASVEPQEAFFSEELGEWLLPYASVRAAKDPAATLLSFLQSTYEAAARLADWSPDLEAPLGRPGRPRAVPDGK